MNRWNASDSKGVVLTAYSSKTAEEKSSKEVEESPPALASRRYGHYNMNHAKATKGPPNRTAYGRSNSQDSLDNLSMDDYWNELDNIQKSRESGHEEQEEVILKVQDEGESEAEWLKEAGLSELLGESAGDKEETIVLLATLTRTQAAAVQKRVETLTQTLRKKNKPHPPPDVRDIFRPQCPEKDQNRSGVESRGGTEKETQRTIAEEEVSAYEPSKEKEKVSVLDDVPVPETDLNLAVSFSEQAADLKDKYKGQIPKGTEENTILPNFRLQQDKTGTTKVGDLAPQDMAKVHSLALIELTALYDILGTEFKHQKAMKIKTKETGLFGVPLSLLLEQDQKKVPGTKIPLLFQKLVSHIEDEGLQTEGLLRIPGAATRIKTLYQELEAKFYEGTFSWDTVKQHDAASLLKHFIRALPQPLLTQEYLNAFIDVQNLPTRKQQLQALNLLVLLLPAPNRDMLKALLEFLQRVIDYRDKNKMTLNNVAMVMAPNLFLFKGLRTKASEQKEFALATGTAGIMRFLIKYQQLLWTIPKFIVAQVRNLNVENQKKLARDRPMKKLLKKRIPERDKQDKQDKSLIEVDIPKGVIRVQAHSFSKVSMAVQLTEELKASDILARFLSQESGVSESINKEDVCLYEIGGNIGERCLDDNTYMKDLYQLNPCADWVIKPRSS
ncbi:rho GTPase-activating protein 18 [Protopterus annectens]|uniref:rho GTPase-activating protein 18 n=1 Tax=Protopterus annectens TaxID=7888 RepID=UPI001CF95CFD|nr:rho GTPase-activating protein 18 [Protopterus annectens]